MSTDWSQAPAPWNEICPAIADHLRRIATMPIEELRAMPLPTAGCLGDPSIADIQAAVCEEFAITRSEMLSDRVDRHVSRPRQIAIFLAREITNRSFGIIATAFNRDYSTAYEAHHRLKSAGGDVAATIARLRLSLAA
jgi:chromosomal replication initiation ATPase DnaA